MRARLRNRIRTEEGSEQVRTVFVCAECGTSSPKWAGRCPACGTWNSLVEQPLPGRRGTSGPASATAVPVTMVPAQHDAHRPTGLDELDRVLGGGLVAGSVVLLAGEPGIGKSTLVLQMLARLAAGGPVLYVTAEESREQVRLRAERIGGLQPGLHVLATTDLRAMLEAAGAVRPVALVVDSVQAVADGDLAGPAGSVGQVRAVAASLVRLAKERGAPVVLVGQVTKDGAVAGPKTLEHVVDVVLNFEGDGQHALRLVRCAKNRFGPADEVGCFEMGEHGLVELTDPSALFLSARRSEVSGVAWTVSLEGRRPLVVEVQALVARTEAAVLRRTAEGPDPGRLAILVAVLDRRAGIPLGHADVFAATVSGVRLAEPAADLALSLALASTARDRVVPAGAVALGEVGLGGEVRPVPGLDRRLAEAARLGFRWAIVPGQPAEPPSGLELVTVPTVADALRLTGILPRLPATPVIPAASGVSAGRNAGVRPLPDGGPIHPAGTGHNRPARTAQSTPA